LIVYGRLGYTTQREICEAMIATECGRLAALGYHIEVPLLPSSFWCVQATTELSGRGQCAARLSVFFKTL